MESVLVKNAKAVKATLRSGRNSNLLVHTISIFQENTDSLVNARMAHDREFRLDCKRGCTFCCHLRVEALPAEVFRIAKYINSCEQTWKADILNRLAAHAEYAAGKTLAEYKRGCAFLSAEGACEIYGVRPHKCRKFVSTSAAECEKGSDTVEDRALLSMANRLAGDTIASYKAKGLVMHPAELGQGVLKALNEPDLVDKWAKGEQVFDLLPERIML